MLVPLVYDHEQFSEQEESHFRKDLEQIKVCFVAGTELKKLFLGDVWR